MILENVIEKEIDNQKERFLKKETGLIRELEPNIKSLSSHALIFSGIRRCGKSTLLLQMVKRSKEKNWLYLNFESPQIFEFSLDDFTRLDNIITRKKKDTLYFDEIQLIPKWEIYVRQKVDMGYKVIITGSNASMLSSELGAKLTGRHITQELFPFSYTEFLHFNKYKNNQNSITEYLQNGGFPEFVKEENEDILIQLFDDILLRDIVARYGIKDIKSLQRLSIYLATNIGNRISATKLKQIIQVSATSTILNWFSFLELSYLFSFIPKFSYSSKVQLINPRKIYSIDCGLQRLVSASTSEDLGRRFENMIYLYLRRKYKQIFYFDENAECDFVIMKNNKIHQLVQVCYDLSSDNFNRELNGLMKAMHFFSLKNGTIVTLSVKDKIKQDKYEIDIIPAYEYLST